MNLPGAPEVLPEDLEGFSRGARLAQHQVVAARDVPVLIKALSVHRGRVDADARRMIERLAGRDLGGEPGPWLDWWMRHQASGRRLVSCGDAHCALAC